jgi:hypothetical protein
LFNRSAGIETCLDVLFLRIGDVVPLRLAYLRATGALELLTLVGVDRLSGGIYQNQHNNGGDDSFLHGIPPFL